MDMRQGVASLLTLVASAQQVIADRISDTISNVWLVDAVMEPAPKGGYANVALRIENGSPRQVSIIRVETARGEPGEFRFHGNRPHADAPPAKSVRPSVAMSYLPIAPGEEVALDTHHLHLQIGPLMRELREGDIVELTFVFEGGWSSTLPIHVHGRETAGR